MKAAKYEGLVLAGLLCEALSGVAAGAAAVFFEECFGDISFLVFPLGLLSCAAFGLIQCAILRCIKYRLSMNLVAYSVFAQLLPAAAGLIGMGVYYALLRDGGSGLASFGAAILMGLLMFFFAAWLITAGAGWLYYLGFSKRKTLNERQG